MAAHTQRVTDGMVDSSSE